MTKRTKWIIGIGLVALIALICLFRGIIDTSLVQSTDAKESISISEDYEFGTNLDLYSILLALTVVLLLIIIIDALLTRRKSDFGRKVQEIRNEINAGKHIVKDNQPSIFIKSIRWVSLALVVFIIVVYVSVFIESVFEKSIEFEFVCVSTAILVLMLAVINILLARRKREKYILIEKPVRSGIGSQTTLIIIGVAGAIITAVGIMWWYNNPIDVARRQLHDEDLWVRRHAIYALIKFGDKASISEITKLLQDNDERVRVASVHALCDLDVKEAIPQITKLLYDSSFDVCDAAINALVAFNAHSNSNKVCNIDCR